MLETLIRNWWLFAVRGVLAALFSIITFLMRGSAESFLLREFALKGLIVFLGMLALAAGVCTIAAGAWTSSKNRWLLLVLDGLAVSAAGLILILLNSISFRMVIYLLLLLATMIGILELAGARTLRRHVPDEWFLGLAGLVSIGFAVAFLWTKPEEPASYIIWLGSYSGFSAICMLGLALRLRSLRRAVHRIAASTSNTG